VDLNAASVQELNSLRGAGLIGKAIMRGRPYRSVDDLLKKRIVNRSLFARIKDQVKVR
jgi:DNA uptake protein ComE-like DNA-binding protein